MPPLTPWPPCRPTPTPHHRRRPSPDAGSAQRPVTSRPEPEHGQQQSAGAGDGERLRPRTGGAALRLPGAGWRARALGRAALALDADTVRGLLTQSIAATGVQATWDDVIRPVLAAVAQRWADTGAGIEIEHLLSDCVTGVFSAVTATAAPATYRAAGTARRDGGRPAPTAPDRARHDTHTTGCVLQVAGRRPAFDGTGDGDPAHRTGRGAAVVPAEIHRRPAGPAIATAHAARISRLRRRPRLGGDGTPAAGRTARVTRGGHRRARRRHEYSYRSLSPPQRNCSIAQSSALRGPLPGGEFAGAAHDMHNWRRQKTLD